MKTTIGALLCFGLLCGVELGCASRPKPKLTFKDGSVLTAKRRHGDTFEQVRYVTHHGRESVKASSATVAKRTIVFTNAVVLTSNGQSFATDKYEVSPPW